MSDSLRPHGLKHTRLPHPSLSPRACSNSCPLLVIPSSHLILCCPLLLLPSIVLSNRVFSNESALRIRWPKYWSFSFSINSSIEYSRLTSFRTDWFDLLAVQGTLKSLLQHHSLKASMHWCSALFMVQLSHLYMIAGKTIALTIQTLVSKVYSCHLLAVWFCIIHLKSQDLSFLTWKRVKQSCRIPQSCWENSIIKNKTASSSW